MQNVQDDWNMLGLAISLRHSKLVRYLLTKYHDPHNPLDLDARNKVCIYAMYFGETLMDV